jgi:hypothetical protein
MSSVDWSNQTQAHGPGMVLKKGLQMDALGGVSWVADARLVRTRLLESTEEALVV